MSPLLEARALHAGYAAVEVLHGIDLSIAAGEAVAVLGPNGAGKSTLLRTLSGLVRATDGSILMAGAAVHTLPAHRIVATGLIQVPEARHIFPYLTVLENLRVGASLVRDAALKDEALDQVMTLFPMLRDKARQPARTLSGGQQQMLAIGRALMGRPRLLMLDEPSLGLAPRVVEEVYEVLHRLRTSSELTILLVEQDVYQALDFVDRAHVLQNGRFALSGSSAELRDNDTIRTAYLGL
ncbi:MAG: ABC transporter ATP-binding protein [Betaproteobacteria bacterium]